MHNPIGELNDEHKKIIKIYSIVRKIIFKYFLHSTIFLIGTILTIGLVLNKTDLEIFKESDIVSMQRIEYKKRFEKHLEQKLNNDKVQTMVLYGTISSTNDNIESIDNLLKYKGYVVPRFFHFNESNYIKEYDVISKSGYINNLEEIKKFANNIVFSKIYRVSNTPIRNQIQLLDRSIEKTFNLSCAFMGQMFGLTCEYYINNFIETFFIYSLNQDYFGLQNIYKTISKNYLYKEEFCKNMQKYILYSKDRSMNLEYIFRDCGVNYLDEFLTIQGFIEIQDQLNNGFIDDTVYHSNDLNIYKLISIQQIIYNEFENRRLNARFITPYMAFVQNVLKKNLLPQFYKDFIYRYNNYYLKDMLDNQIFVNRNFETEKFVEDIRIINIGSTLIGFEGLDKQLLNKSLMTQNLSNNNEYSKDRISIGEHFKKISQLSYFTVTNRQINDFNVFVEGYFHIKQDIKINPTISVDLNMIFEKNNFFISKLKIYGYEELTEIVNYIISKNKFTLSQLYQYISDNIFFYTENTKHLNICDIINIIIKQSNGTITSCDENKILFSSNSSGKPEDYTIYIKNYNIENIIISNKDYEKGIKEKLKLIKTTYIDLPEWIRIISEYKIEDNIKDTKDEINIDIINNFQSFLGITPSDIKNIDSKNFLIEFSMGGIMLRGEYNIDNKKISIVYFKDVFFKENLEVFVKNFDLTLEATNKNNINQFVIDPMEYIKNININAYRAYIKYK